MFVSFLAFVLTLIFIVSPAIAEPTISWTQAQTAEIVAQGEKERLVVSFISKKDLSDVNVWIVPELEQYVSVEPSSFSRVRKNEAVSIVLNFEIPIDAPVSSINGTLHLRESRKSKKTFAKPLPIKIIIEESIAGKDLDQNGVRDDIQEYIMSAYPESQKVQAALIQNAKALQIGLINADNREASITIGDQRVRAVGCLSYISGPEEGRIFWGELRARMLNSDSRSRAYIKANNHLGGQIYQDTPPDEGKSLCDFDPDLMEN
jgi:hypothetical protein